MAALEAGVVAPDFTLNGMNGEKISLAEARKKGPVVAAFFKISCPVCQYAFPYLERIFKAYPNSPATLVGVSQDDKRDTAGFAREYGITFPLLLDDARTYPASNAYGLTNVPSIFLISPGGKVELSSVGWSKRDIEDLNARVAQAAGAAPAKIFQPGEDVADFKPG
ncbi:MAG: peroxiredoxin family protein [Terriglobales bacterium]